MPASWLGLRVTARLPGVSPARGALAVDTAAQGKGTQRVREFQMIELNNLFNRPGWLCGFVDDDPRGSDGVELVAFPHSGGVGFDTDPYPHFLRRLGFASEPKVSVSKPGWPPECDVPGGAVVRARIVVAPEAGDEAVRWRSLGRNAGADWQESPFLVEAVNECVTFWNRELSYAYQVAGAKAPLNRRAHVIGLSRG